jgi:hypothetical protein
MCGSRLEITLAAGDSIKEVENLLESQASEVAIEIIDDINVDIDDLAFQHGYIVTQRYGEEILLELA